MSSYSTRKREGKFEKVAEVLWFGLSDHILAGSLQHQCEIRLPGSASKAGKADEQEPLSSLLHPSGHQQHRQSKPWTFELQQVLQNQHGTARKSDFAALLDYMVVS